MVKFSTHWKSSARPGKQRKYRYNAPLHVKQKLVHAHLNKPLVEKYGLRSAQVRVGDKVKIMRGSFARRETKVERVLLRLERVLLVGIDRVKKDGNRVKIPIHPSNLMIVDLDLGDKKRSAHFTEAAKKSVESVVKKVKKVSVVGKVVSTKQSSQDNSAQQSKASVSGLTK